MNRVDTVHILETVTQYTLQETTPELISDWHYQIGHLDKAVAAEAVNIHHKTSAETITPQHVLDLATQIATRNPSQQRMRRARMGAYTTTGALNDPCDNCGAAPGETCTSKSGHEAFSPCVTRLVGKRQAA